MKNARRFYKGCFHSFFSRNGSKNTQRIHCGSKIEMVRNQDQEVKFARKNSRKFTRNRILAGDCLPDNKRFLLQPQTAPILTMICGLRIINLLQLLFRQFEEIYFEIRFARGNQLIDHQVQNLMSNNVITVPSAN